MNIIELCLKRSVLGWVLMSGLIIFGAVTMNKLGVSQLPDVNFPVLNVSISYPGAAPEVIESEIISKTEERLLSVEGIKEIKSTASQGSASINLEFAIGHNIDVALQEVQTAISQIRFPTSVDNPVIRKTNPEEDPILFISLKSNKDIKEMIHWTESYFLDQIQFIPGVGEVSANGFPNRNLRVWLDLNKLKKYELTISDVVEAIRSQHIEAAAGQYVEARREVRVRLLGEASSVSDIANIIIQKRGGQLIQDKIFYVKDVAQVEDGLADIKRIARVDGQTAVSIQVKKQRGVNEVDVADAVLKKLGEIKYPEGYQYKVNVNYTQSTRSTVSLTKEKLILASIVTILVCFLFLGNVQSAVNILFSIPTSILGTFIIIYFSNFTLNMFTLLALTLSVSIVVDDAIMILENIIRHFRMGKTPYQAALDGAVEVIPAAVAASMAVLAVFLPVLFMDGVIGQFLFQFGVTMSAAVLLSLLEAVTITPMRAAAILRTQGKVTRFEERLDEIFHKLSEHYKKWLMICLQNKYKTITVSFIFFGLSLYVFTKLKQEFIPTQDQNLIILTAQAKPGTSLEETKKLVEPLEEKIRGIKEISGYLISIGTGQVFLPINLVDASERKMKHTEIMNVIREGTKDIKGLRISMRDISARNLTTGRLNPVAFNLRGPDLEVLNTQAQNIIKKLEEEKMAVDLDTDFKLGIPELHLAPDRAAMLKKGVTIEALSDVLQTAVAGLRAGQFTADGKRNDIRFKVLDEQIKSAEDIKKLYVRNNYGNLIEVGELVKEEEKKALQNIIRVNRQRSVSVYGNLQANKSQSAVLEEAKRLADENLPSGYSFNLEGAAAGFASSFSNIYLVLATGIMVAYMILAVQFNSFLSPISILMALPFSISGALIILWMANSSINLYSFIGLIVLMGIAKKNSIMLVEFTVQKMKHDKLDILAAIEAACPVRLRPILMTSTATVLAAIPLIMGTDIGHETRTPMGLVIIGGTIVSTLFTLFVVPALFFSINNIFKRKKSAS